MEWWSAGIKVKKAHIFSFPVSFMEYVAMG
jgi:hypothetical protein